MVRRLYIFNPSFYCLLLIIRYCTLYACNYRNIRKGAFQWSQQPYGAFELVLRRRNEKSDSKIRSVFRDLINFDLELNVVLKYHIVDSSIMRGIVSKTSKMIY